MVFELSTVPTTLPTSKFPKLEPSSSLEPSTTNSSPLLSRYTLSQRWSIHRCTPTQPSTSRCLPVSMEATKALALKWKRKSSSLSLRRSSSNKSTKKEARAAAEDARAQAVRDSCAQKDAVRRKSLKTVDTTTAPAFLPTDLSAANLPLTTALDVPQNPSPGSDISPGNEAAPNPANGNTEREQSPVSPNTVDYFTLAQLTGAAPPPKDAPPGKITFSIPSKTDGANGKARKGGIRLARRL